MTEKNIPQFQDVPTIREEDFQPNLYDIVLEDDAKSAFETNLYKAMDDHSIEPEDIEKAKRDLSRLAQRKITDRNGHSRIVWVKVTDDDKGKTKTMDFEEGHKVSFNKNGEEFEGTIKSLKYNEKTDKYGTAIVETKDGRKFSVSMRALNRVGELPKDGRKRADVVAENKKKRATDKEKESTTDEHGVSKRKNRAEVVRKNKEKRAAAKEKKEPTVEEATEKVDKIKKDLERKKKVAADLESAGKRRKASKEKLAAAEKNKEKSTAAKENKFFHEDFDPNDKNLGMGSDAKSILAGVKSVDKKAIEFSEGKIKENPRFKNLTDEEVKRLAGLVNVKSHSTFSMYDMRTWFMDLSASREPDKPKTTDVRLTKTRVARLNQMGDNPLVDYLGESLYAGPLNDTKQEICFSRIQ